MPTSGTEKVPEISEEAIRLGQEAADDLLQREIDAGNLLMATHPAVAQAILQAALPAIRQSVLSEVREELLGEAQTRHHKARTIEADGGDLEEAVRLHRAGIAIESALATITPEEESRG